MKRAILGVIVVLLYIGAAMMFSRPVRPLFDGSGPPQPYRWVSPPPDFAQTNQKPKPFGETVGLTPKGITGASIQTDDGQATLIVPERSFAAKAGARSVRFRIAPLQAKSLEPGPPKTPQGNAYRITARYLPSGGEAEPVQNVTVLLRFPAHATDIDLYDGKTWRRLKSESIPSSLQIYANTKKLGTFVAAGGGSSRKILWIITGGVSFLGATLGLVIGLRERRSRPKRRRH